MPAAFAALVVASVAFAETAAVPPGAPASHVFSAGERAQLAAEAGLSEQQAAGLTLSQLAYLKARHDGNDNPYAIRPSMQPGWHA